MCYSLPPVCSAFFRRLLLSLLQDFASNSLRLIKGSGALQQKAPAAVRGATTGVTLEGRVSNEVPAVRATGPSGSASVIEFLGQKIAALW